jgi:hypothetical protein
MAKRTSFIKQPGAVQRALHDAGAGILHAAENGTVHATDRWLLHSKFLLSINTMMPKYPVK